MRVNGSLAGEGIRVNGRVMAVSDGLMLFHAFDAALFSGSPVMGIWENSGEFRRGIFLSSEWAVWNGGTYLRDELSWVRAVCVVVPWRSVITGLGKGITGPWSTGTSDLLVSGTSGVYVDTEDDFSSLGDDREVLSGLAKRLVDDGVEFARLANVLRSNELKCVLWSQR